MEDQKLSSNSTSYKPLLPDKYDIRIVDSDGMPHVFSGWYSFEISGDWIRITEWIIVFKPDNPQNIQRHNKQQCAAFFQPKYVKQKMLERE